MSKFLKLLIAFNKSHSPKIDNWWIGYAISALGFGIAIIAFYPGYMSPDSIANLTQGRTGFFYDINSPVMSYLWGVLDGIYAGPALMLIMHNLMFWGGCAIFWKATRNRSAKLGISLVLLGFMPQILSQFSTIWKDVGLAASLYLSAAIIYYSFQKKSRVLLLTPALLFYAYGMRLNAFPAILPFCVWSGIVVYSLLRLNFAKRQRYLFVTAFSGIYFAILSFGVNLTNQFLTEGRTVYPFQQVYLYDLAAISKARGESVFPDYVANQKNFAMEKVITNYDVRQINRLIFGDDPVLELSNDPNEIVALRNKWIEAVYDNKYSYLSAPKSRVCSARRFYPPNRDCSILGYGVC